MAAQAAAALPVLVTLLALQEPGHTLPAQKRTLPRRPHIHVACGCSLHQSRALATLVNSLVFHHNASRTELHVHVLALEEDEAPMRALFNCMRGTPEDAPLESWEANPERRAALHLRVFDPSAWHPNIVTASASRPDELGSPYNWVRFYLTPDDLAGATRFLWIDCDVIARADISLLFEEAQRTDAGSPIWSVRFEEPLYKHLCADHPRYARWWAGGSGSERMALTDPRVRAINAGVTLFDLERWRGGGYLDRWHALTLEHNRSCLWQLAGQPELHLLLDDRINPLGRRWNVGFLGAPRVPSLRGSKALEVTAFAKAQGGLLHWNGNLKPWREPFAGRYQRAAKDKGATAAIAAALRAQEESAGELAPLLAELWWLEARRAAISPAFERCNFSLALPGPSSVPDGAARRRPQPRGGGGSKGSKTGGSGSSSGPSAKERSGAHAQKRPSSASKRGHHPLAAAKKSFAGSSFFWAKHTMPLLPSVAGTRAAGGGGGAARAGDDAGGWEWKLVWGGND